MEKLEALPVQIILSIDSLRTEIDEIAYAKDDLARKAAHAKAIERLEIMNGMAAAAAEELPRVGRPAGGRQGAVRPAHRA
jgi:hypothetical protein